MLHLLSLAVLPQAVVERIGAGDDVVLQQDMVWTVLQGHCDNAKLLQLLANGCQIYVLQDMLAVHGIKTSSVLSGVKIIDYPGLVELTVKNPVIHSWCA
jgi:tRNA 2-thiouridine synthesizing protein B